MQAGQRLKTLEEFIQITDKGGIIIDGKEEPTDLQISQAIRKYARQYGQIVKISEGQRFLLKNAHHMVGDKKGTIKTKKEWMEENNWNEEKFNILVSTAVLVRR